MEYKLKIGEDTLPVDFEKADDSRINLTMEDKEYDISYSRISDNQIHISVNGKRINAYVSNTEEGKSIFINGVAYLVQDADNLERKSSKKRGGQEIPTDITPVTPSVIVAIPVEVGETVKKGQVVAILSAMKMEISLNSPYDGTITAVNAAEGDNVSPGTILVEIEEEQKESDSEESST